MSPEEEFIKQHMGTFEPDLRAENLRDALIQYYQDTEYCDIYAASVRWREFRQWARYSGFTSHEINNAKRSIPPSRQ